MNHADKKKKKMKNVDEEDVIIISGLSKQILVV